MIDQVVFWGYVVSTDGIHIDDEKVKAILDHSIYASSKVLLPLWLQ